MNNLLPNTRDQRDRIRANAAKSRESDHLGLPRIGIYRVPATGGEPVLVLRSDQTAQYRLPAFLPDGRHFLVLRTPTQGTEELHLAALDRQDTTSLLAADSQARYANGHLFFTRAEALLAAPFDADGLKLTGEPFVVADKVNRSLFTVSDNGSLVYDLNTPRND